MKAFLDTHAAVFLWQADRDLFGPASLDLLESSALFVSPAVRLELTLLHELRKLRPDADQILGALASEAGLSESNDLLGAVVSEATALTWTRDPFDRLIVATAALHRAPLVTRDERIRKHYKKAIW